MLFKKLFYFLLNFEIKIMNAPVYEPKSLTTLAFLELVKDWSLTQILIKCEENPIFEKFLLETSFMVREAPMRDYTEVRDAYTRGFKDFLLEHYSWGRGLQIHFNLTDNFGQFGLHQNPLYVHAVELSNLFIRLSRANWYAIEFIQPSRNSEEEDTTYARVGEVVDLGSKRPPQGLIDFYESRMNLDYGDVRYHLVLPNVQVPQRSHIASQAGRLNNLMMIKQTSDRFSAQLSYCGDLEDMREGCDVTIYDCIKCNLDPRDPLHDEMSREEVFSKLLLDGKFEREWPEDDREKELFSIIRLF